MKRYLSIQLLAVAALAAQANRIADRIEDAARVPLRHHTPVQWQGAQDLGRLDDSFVLDNMVLLLKRSPAQQQALEALLTQQQDPKSPQFHHWLTPAQFADQFGLSKDDFAKVTAWLESSGFEIANPATARNWIRFKGSHQKIANAFHTEIHRLQAEGVPHYANVSDPQIPSALSGVVSGIHGLNNFDPEPASRQTLIPHYHTIDYAADLGPSDLAAAYDVQPLYDAGIKGDGVSIAVIGRADFQMSDIVAYKNLFGLPANLPQTVFAGPDPGAANTGDVVEAELDLEIVGGIAPNASLKFVNSPSVITSMLYAIDNNVASIITYSYDSCEQQPSLSPTTWQGYIQQANALGITFFASSGDAGPADCDRGATSATHGLAVALPASVPEVTAVGGTQIEIAPSNLYSQFPAIRFEQAWNEAHLSGSSGGGPSHNFSKPTWQSGTSVPPDSVRDVPDIAFSAGYMQEDYPYAVCLNGSCQLGEVVSIGGTSASSPLAAGVLALVTQYQIVQGAQSAPGLGNINPRLYQLAQTSPAAFRDIRVGNNMVPCTVGTPDCSGGALSFTAGTGYDFVTGLGTIDAFNTAKAWNLSSSRNVSTAVMQPTMAECDNGTQRTYSIFANVTTSAQAVSGAVYFFDSSLGYLGSVPVSSAGATATATLSFTQSDQARTFYAVYSGDNDSLGSVSPDATLVDTSESPTVSLAASSVAVVEGVPIFLTASSTSFCGPFPGTITVTDQSNRVLFTGTENASGSVTFSPGYLSAGFYRITANYSGKSSNTLFIDVAAPGLTAFSISVTAGGASKFGSTGDGGPASAATFTNLSGIAIDSHGNKFLADVTCCIRRIDTSGIITTYASAGDFSGLAVAPDDTLYAIRGYTVVKIVNGNPVTVAGSGATSGLYQGDGIAAVSANIYPVSIAVGADGTLYISDGSSNSRIYSVSGGIIKTFAGGGRTPLTDGVPAKSALLAPALISLDSLGNMYVETFSSLGEIVYRIDAAGILHPFAGNPSAAYPTANSPALSTPLNIIAMAADSQGNLFVADGGRDSYSPSIIEISGGQCIRIAGNGTEGTQSSQNALFGQVQYPTGIAVDGQGNIYVINSGMSHPFVQLIQPYSNTLNTPLRFVPVTPCRVADTRANTAVFGGFLPGNTGRDFPISAASCGIPTNAQAYSLNVTVVPHGVLNYLSIWPTNLPQPLVSTLNSDGRVKANAVILRAGDNNSVSTYVTDDTDVVLDINGYFVPAATSTSALAFYPLAPCRVADTRGNNGPLAGPYLSAGQTRALPVLSSGCGIPSNAQAYSMNFTAIAHTPIGFLSTWPTGTSQPFVSTLNAPLGGVVANAAIVPAGPDGGINVYSSHDTDLAIDINGYFAPPTASGLSLYTVLPCRPLDTRNPTGSPPFNGTIAVGISSSNCAIPNSAQAFVLNATVVPTAGTLSFLTLWPDGQSKPFVSTLNAEDGVVNSNLAIVPTLNGSVDAFSTNRTHLILDISGYFAP